ncbi:hypothetical protein X474_09150 [Dethiosulfatarculus sandiegensis]|uniref:Uncharacterized protein n=1 Tax=Dethiosulfatarculus sandiegensis TaxID=1429043 RepID=A0A0D2HVD7_9BACT|nr:hypothetical protein X474_09150 [Dethiosulfatarculus sandiegensis]
MRGKDAPVKAKTACRPVIKTCFQDIKKAGPLNPSGLAARLFLQV